MRPAPARTSQGAVADHQHIAWQRADTCAVWRYTCGSWMGNPAVVQQCSSDSAAESTHTPESRARAIQLRGISPAELIYTDTLVHVATAVHRTRAALCIWMTSWWASPLACRKLHHCVGVLHTHCARIRCTIGTVELIVLAESTAEPVAVEERCTSTRWRARCGSRSMLRSRCRRQSRRPVHKIKVSCPH